jgi:hypothetical protein
MATNSSERGRFLALPRWWTVVAQACPAQPPALPAVVHRPALRLEAMAASSGLYSPDNNSAAIFPVFSFIVGRKPLAISHLQKTPLKISPVHEKNRRSAENNLNFLCCVPTKTW